MKICEGFVGSGSASSYHKIRISASHQEGVQLFSTGVEGAVAVRIPHENVKIENEGEVCLHHGKFQSFLQNLQGEIRLSYTNGYVEMVPIGKSGVRRIYAKFFVFPTQIELRKEVAELMNNPVESAIEISAQLLRTVLEKTSFCAAKEDAGRFTLKGVCIKYNKANKVIDFVALDGFKMGFCTLPVESTFEDQSSFSVVLPSGVIGKISSILSLVSGEENIRMSLMGDRFCFWFPGHVISSRISDGEFPDVQNFFRSQYDFGFSMSFQGFRRAVKSVASVIGEEDRKISFEINPDTQELLATCVDPSHGEGWERIFMETCTLPPEKSISVHFNTKHLLRILSKMHGESISFFFQGVLSPFRIQEESRVEDTKCFYVLMPMKEATPVPTESSDND